MLDVFQLVRGIGTRIRAYIREVSRHIRVERHRMVIDMIHPLLGITQDKTRAGHRTIHLHVEDDLGSRRDQLVKPWAGIHDGVF